MGEGFYYFIAAKAFFMTNSKGHASAHSQAVDYADIQVTQKKVLSLVSLKL